MARNSPDAERAVVSTPMRRARGRRLWNRYLRVAAAIASLIGNTLLTGMYFILLPPFVWAARRAERRETPGWHAIAPDCPTSPTSEY